MPHNLRQVQFCHGILCVATSRDKGLTHDSPGQTFAQALPRKAYGKSLKINKK